MKRILKFLLSVAVITLLSMPICFSTQQNTTQQAIQMETIMNNALTYSFNDKQIDLELDQNTENSEVRTQSAIQINNQKILDDMAEGFGTMFSKVKSPPDDKELKEMSKMMEKFLMMFAK